MTQVPPYNPGAPVVNRDDTPSPYFLRWTEEQRTRVNSEIVGITPISRGGTDADNASDARTNLGLAIGSDVQAYDAGLQSISGLTTSADKMIYTTGANVYATTALTAFARSMLDDADAATARSTLGTVLQTSATDATADRLFKMSGTGTQGAFGLGGLGSPVLSDIDDTSLRTGFHASISSTVGTHPAGHSDFGTLIQARYGSADFFQIYQGVLSDELTFRRYRSASGGMQAWQHIASTEGGRHIQQCSFATRADFVTAASNIVAADGDVVVAEGLAYEYSSGATDISDLSDFIPAGDTIYAQHFADVDDGENISSALTTALEYAFTNNVYSVSALPGRYLVNSLIDADMGSNGSPARPFVIDLEGVILEVPSSNTTGCLKITKNNNFQHLRIRNVEIQSAAAIGNDADPTNGTGLNIVSSLQAGDPGWGTPAAKEVVLENVHVVSKAPANYGRWDNGIIIDSCWFPELRGCWADTRHPGDTNTNFESGSGIYINNCFQPYLVSCRANGRWLYGIRIDEDTDFGYEDFQLTGCYSEQSRDALTIQMSSAAKQAASLKEPGGRVSGGHFNGHRRAIYVGDRRQFTIDGCLLYLSLAAGANDYAGAAYVYLHDCKDVNVTNCLIPEGGHYTSDSDCSTHVRLDGNTDYVQVRGNEFGADGIAVYDTTTGTNNIVEGNIYESSSGSPTKKFVDSSGTIVLNGGDVVREFTPELEFGGATTGITYSTQSGWYVQHGRQITFVIDILLTSKGTATGSAEISTGLPAALSGANAAFDVGFSNSMNQGTVGGVLLASGNLDLYHYDGSDNLNQGVADGDFTNTTRLKISGTYISAA